jgi:hypothetical protein
MMMKNVLNFSELCKLFRNALMQENIQIAVGHISPSLDFLPALFGPPVHDQASSVEFLFLNVSALRAAEAVVSR